MIAPAGPLLNRSWNTGEPTRGVGARAIRPWPHSKPLNVRDCGSVTVRHCAAPQIRRSPGGNSLAEAGAAKTLTARVSPMSLMPGIRLSGQRGSLGLLSYLLFGGGSMDFTSSGVSERQSPGGEDSTPNLPSSFFRLVSTSPVKALFSIRSADT